MRGQKNIIYMKRVAILPAVAPVMGRLILGTVLNSTIDVIGTCQSC